MTFCRILSLMLAAAIAQQLVDTPPPSTATIEIDASAAGGPISPQLYGQFIEFMFEGIKYGLHAEMIRNRGFEEEVTPTAPSPSWERYPDDRNDDYAISISRVADVAYPAARASDGTTGGHSLRVQLRPGVVTRHGVYQARLPIRKGIAYRGYVWMKTDAFAGAVTLALETDAAGGARYSESRIAVVDGDWKQYSFTLTPTATDPLARFAILFDGQGTVWIDQVSLMPGDAVDGVRADVFDKVKALHPAFIRWPGGNVAQDYHWRWGIGPRDARPTWINLSWHNELERSDFGTDEFIRFARNVGAEPSITVNVEGRGATVEEAAAWVEYCNGPATSTYGAHAGTRRPCRAVSGEILGDRQRNLGRLGTRPFRRRDLRPQRHPIRRRHARRRSGDQSDRRRRQRHEMEPHRAAAAGARFDYLAIHHYYSQRDMQGDLNNLLARPLHFERFYGEIGVVSPGARAGAAAQPGDQRVGARPAGVAAIFGRRGSVCRQADERVRAARRSRGDERRVGYGERLAGRHHSGQSSGCVRDADLSGQPSVCLAPGNGASPDQG